MKTHLRFAYLLVCLLISLSSFSQNRTAAPGIIRIKLKESYGREMKLANVSPNKLGIDEIDNLNSTFGVKRVKRVFREAGKYEKAHRKFGLHLWYELEMDNNIPLANIIKKYKELPHFEVVESRLTYHRIDPVVAEGKQSPKTITGPVNDPLFSQQWHYNNTGQTGGTPGDDISLVEAWTLQTGSPDVIVAVIDGGIDVSHADLAGSMWVNTGETPGNGIDDDGNGYIDDINGYGFGDNTGTIHPDEHGTHVGGTIAAVTNNGTGVAGVAGGSGSANGVRLISCAAFGQFGIGGFEDAMVYAADNGAVISQNSWGGGGTSIEAAIDYFIARAGYDNSEENFDNNIQTGPMAGGIVIFAAGNDDTDSPLWGYPGSYEPVMAVASTDHNDVKSWFSNYGSWVDISAPGSDVYSTLPSNTYGANSGTSMACPHVSGVAALIVSEFGGPSFDPSVVWTRIQTSADYIEDDNPSFIGALGSGRLNAYQALQSPDDIPPATIVTLAVASVGLNSVTLSWIAPGASENEGTANYYSIRYSTSPINAGNFNSAIPVSNPPKPKLAGSTEEMQITGLSHSTTYYFAIKAGDFFGNLSETSNVVSTTTSDPPVIEASPDSLTLTLFSGDQEDTTLHLTNSGESDLQWEISISGTGTSNLENALQNLQDNFTSINSIIPNRYDFYEGLTGNNIDDGGNDMYDGGNFISTNLGSNINYTNATLSSSSYFGLPGNYFTAKFPGLFVLAANTDISNFSIFGNLGADGSGSVDGHVLTLSYKGKNFKGFIKRVYGAGDPSVNHLMIVEDNGTVTHNYSFSTDSDSHGLQNLEGIERLYYLLFAGSSGSYISNASMENIMVAFLDAIQEGPSWLNVQQASGVLSPGSSDQVVVTADAAGLIGGVYESDITVHSNDPLTPEITIPVTLTVTGAPNIEASTQSADFGDQFIGGHYDTTIMIRNDGTDSLKITSISENSDAFSVAPSSLILLPDEEAELTITFSPDTPGIFNASIILVSNDPNDGAYLISASGTGALPPVIEVNPSSLTADLFSGETTTRTLTIENTGSSMLNWQIELTYDSSVQITSTAFFKSEFATPSVNNSGLPVNSEIIGGPYPRTPGSITELAASPVPLTCIATDPSTGMIYGQGNNNNTFYRYNPQNNTWSQLANCPIYSGNNGGAAFLNGKIYTVYTSNSSLIGVYNVSGNTWSTIPNDLGAGTGNIAAHGSYLYMVAGSYFKRYEPASDTWTILASPPFSFHPWGGLAIHENVIYGHSGNGTSGFAKYNIATNSWTALPYVPGGAVLGCAIDHRSEKYFTYGSFDGLNLYTYDINSNSWSITLLPFSVSDGGIAAISTAGVSGVYFVQGESGTRFAKLQTLPDENWIQANLTEGQIPAGESMNVEVQLNADGLFGGVYYGNINIASNDPVTPVLSVPVTLNVTGTPDISVSQDNIAYGESILDIVSDTLLTVVNAGTDELTISGISIDDPRFTVEFTTATLSPGEERDITVSFLPTEAIAYSGILTITSNDPDQPVVNIPLSGTGVHPAVMTVNPGIINSVLIAGEQENRTINITNSGGSNLSWQVSVHGTAAFEIEDVLQNIQANYESVTDIIPNMYDFSGGTTGSSISDGGNNMYDWGNYLFTDFDGLDYTNGIIYNSPALGTGGKYFTAKFPGLFVLAADLDITTFGIDGSLGAAGSGAVDGHVATIVHQGKTFKGFIKRVYGAGSVPSVNHLIIVEDNGMANHAFFEYSYYDYHIIQNLSGISRLYYLLFAGSSGYYIDNSTIENMMSTFLTAIGEGNSWMSVNKTSGSISQENADEITININAQYLAPGSYEGKIIATGNDFMNPSDTTVVYLTVETFGNIYVSSSPLNFGGVDLETTARRSVVIHNFGPGPLNISSVSVSNPEFRVPAITPLVLNAGEDTTMTIRFTPLTAGPVTGTLEIISDDPDESSKYVTLTGYGLPPTAIEDEISDTSFKNHPNPFSEETTISYHLLKSSHVTIFVQDMHGRTICTLMDEIEEPGKKEILYKGQLSPGMYYCYLVTDGEITAINKMVKY